MDDYVLTIELLHFSTNKIDNKSFRENNKSIIMTNPTETYNKSQPIQDEVIEKVRSKAIVKIKVK